MIRNAALAALFALLTVSPASQAARLLTVEEGIRSVFGPEAEVVTETKTLSGEEVAAIEERLGFPLVDEVEAEEPEEETRAAGRRPGERPRRHEDVEPAEVEAEESEEGPVFDFYLGSEEGEPLGTALVVAAPGKWGPVEYIVAMDPGGAVTRVEVLFHEEKRGRDVTRRTFLNQFEGLTCEVDISLEETITAVSGATVSSRSACLAVTKAVTLYEHFYLAPPASGEDAEGE